MKIKHFVLCACAAASLTLSASSSFARELLRVGTEPTFAPFEFLDTTKNEYTGFDMDLIRAVADKAGFDVKIYNMGFDALIPALISGSIDVVAAGLSITPERAARIDFTTPYYTSGLSMLVQKANAKKFQKFSDLEGQRIAVQIGNTGADRAKSIKGAKVVTFNTTSDAFLDLAAGNSQAVILDRPVLAYFLKQQADTAKDLVMQPVIEDAQQYGFGVKKGNKELLDKLNKGLEAVRQAGEDKQIYSKWFAQ